MAHINSMTNISAVNSLIYQHTVFSTTSSNTIYSAPNSTSSIYYPITNPQYSPDVLLKLILENGGKIKLSQGMECAIELPDGAVLVLNRNGNYQLLDDNAKVIYKANRTREFNKYLNASDLLAKFIEYVAELKLTKQEFLKLPIELFIAWLILESAKQDGEEIDKEAEQKLLTYRKHKPRCGWCGKWISKFRQKNGLLFCNPIHFEKKSTKLEIACV